MIGRIAIAIGLLVIALAGFYGRRSPLVRTPSVPLEWVTNLDAGALTIVMSVSGVDFARVTDHSLHPATRAVVRRGEALFALEDVDTFLLVGHYGHRVWALADRWQGDTFALLVSEDEGRTFERRATLQKDLGALEGWVILGEEIALTFTRTGEGTVPDQWTWPWWRGPVDERRLPDFAYPSLGPGAAVLRSKNGGRSWRLER